MGVAVINGDCVFVFSTRQSFLRGRWSRPLMREMLLWARLRCESLLHFSSPLMALNELSEEQGTVKECFIHLFLTNQYMNQPSYFY